MGKEENFKGSKGRKFGEGQTIANNGRPKSLIKQWNEQLKAEGYEIPSSTDYDNIGLSLLDKPFSYLQEIVEAFKAEAKQHPTPRQKELQINTPYFICLICKDLLGKNGFQVAEKLRDRAHGKPTTTEKQEHTITSTSGIIQVSVNNSTKPPILEE